MLKNHISHSHCEALKRVSVSGQSSMSQDGSIFVYNLDALREQFAGLVIQRGLPFNHFDDEQTTRVFQKHLQPKYNHISLTALKRDVMKLWVAAKQAIIDGFANLNTNFNLTTDVWSAPHEVPGSYICVTAHWIEPGTWQRMKRVIAFEDFSIPHTRSALARTLIKTFVNFNLENKIMSITLDNASNNTSAIAGKPSLSPNWDIPIRWSSTYHMFQCGLKQISTLMYFHDLLASKELLIESISTDLEFFDDSYATKAKKWFNDSLKGLYNICYAKYGNITTELSSGTSSSRASDGNQMSRLLNRLQEHRKKKVRNDPSLSSEYERYVNSDFVTHHDNSAFATFDLLASKSAFSTSGRVLSIRRTRLTLASLKMCMCLKDHLDAQERKQHKSGLETPIDFEEEILDAEVQQF
nr:putative transcription factor/ chromatin remodeling BED-type(Zn) family [Tanacetum cinerariifolium]